MVYANRQIKSMPEGRTARTPPRASLIFRDLTPGITRPRTTDQAFHLTDGTHPDAGRVHVAVRSQNMRLARGGVRAVRPSGIDFICLLA
jgi:hypothetical protein